MTPSPIAKQIGLQVTEKLEVKFTIENLVVPISNNREIKLLNSVDTIYTSDFGV